MANRHYGGLLFFLLYQFVSISAAGVFVVTKAQIKNHPMIVNSKIIISRWSGCKI